MRNNVRGIQRYGGVLLAFLLVTIGAGISVQVQGPADFTGVWVLDPGRSEGLPEGISQKMTVKQAGDRVDIETIVATPQGEQRLKDVYVLDGTETEYVPPVIGDGSGKGKRTSRWLDKRDGFEATESARISGPDGDADITASRRWTLAPDNKTLTIEMTVSGLQGEQKSRRVFVKQ
jgi:hypothetical protein